MPIYPQRKSIRLAGYDYAQAGVYFFTVCTHRKTCVFGDIVLDEMRLNACGRIIQDEWLATGQKRVNVTLDAFVIMPNHVHGILAIRRGAAHQSRIQRTFGFPVSQSFSVIVGAFKSASTKRINQVRGTPGACVWQRNYHERVVRDDTELTRLRGYIEQNPLKWALDREYPRNLRG